MAFSHQDLVDGLDRQEVVDSINVSAVEGTKTATTSAQAVRVGGSNLSNRKYVFIEAQGSNVLWGFTSTCVFNAYKNQAIWIPAGPGVDVYIKTTSGSVTVAVAEGS